MTLHVFHAVERVSNHMACHIERILFSVKNKSENKNGKSVDIFLFAAYNKIIRK